MKKTWRPMTKILMSIKPEYAEAILNGSKLWEFRRRIWRHWQPFWSCSTKIIVIYATIPMQKVIGEFNTGVIYHSPPDELWTRALSPRYNPVRNEAGILESEFFKYFKGAKKGFAIEVINPIRYEKPLTLLEATGFDRPPQSWRYLND